jgi:hypothetical protein
LDKRFNGKRENHHNSINFCPMMMKSLPPINRYLNSISIGAWFHLKWPIETFNIEKHVLKHTT